jgi:hypothetical protein
MFRILPISAERRNSMAKFSLYFYVLFAGLLVFADASHQRDWLKMLFGLIALPNAVVLRSLLRRTPAGRS